MRCVREVSIYYYKYNIWGLYRIFQAQPQGKFGQETHFWTLMGLGLTDMYNKRYLRAVQDNLAFLKSPDVQ